MRAFFALFLFTALAVAADLTGQWAGKTKLSIDGRIEEDTMYLSLKQEGDRLTGTAGPTAQQQAPIRNGKVDANHIAFELPVPNGVFVFDLNLVDGHLKGDVVAAAQGQSLKATLDATKSK